MQDFDSASLKHKKHWNSFTTSFFLELPTVVTKLQKDERLSIDTAAAEAMLKQDLHCHICGQNIKNMPTLKAHIKVCKHG